MYMHVFRCRACVQMCTCMCSLYILNVCRLQCSIQLDIFLNLKDLCHGI